MTEQQLIDGIKLAEEIKKLKEHLQDVGESQLQAGEFLSLKLAESERGQVLFMLKKQFLPMDVGRFVECYKADLKNHITKLQNDFKNI